MNMRKFYWSYFKNGVNKINDTPAESEVRIDLTSSVVLLEVGSTDTSHSIDLDELLFLCFTSSAQHCGAASGSNISAVTFGNSRNSRNCSLGV